MCLFQAVEDKKRIKEIEKEAKSRAANRKKSSKKQVGDSML